MRESPSLASLSFGPEAVQRLCGAFDEAWRRLEDAECGTASGEGASVTREMVARWIIVRATWGETDPQRLAEGALDAIRRPSAAEAGRRMAPSGRGPDT